MHAFQIFFTFLRLGLTSFGGPVAHIGYFRKEFVEKKAWLDEAAFADFLALCQFLPGPSSSQLGIAIGLSRGGLPGAALAWLGFTLPSALVLAWCGIELETHRDLFGGGWVHGLKLLACAVVAEAVWSLGRKFTADRWRQGVMGLALILVLLMPGAAGQISAMGLAALLGQWLPREDKVGGEGLSLPLPGWLSWPALILLAFGLVGLPVLAGMSGDPALGLFDRFFRAGLLVFGGGHVVLPLLRDALVPAGWIADDRFLAGYALAQTVPGPLFTFAAYLGAAVDIGPRGWAGAGLGVAAIFLPSFLMLLAVLPHWHRLRKIGSVRRALEGVNAAVVGLLLAALYDPVFTSSVSSGKDFAVAALLFLLLTAGRVPVVALVALGAGLGMLV
ncbi:MAG TPA: chromate efflux transporter [Magnetospirillaceae bacterium]|nr:chromate efflux transporter [Magnetospirillaceae bacterium]